MTSPEIKPDSSSLTETLKRLRGCSQLDIQPHWHAYSGDLSADQIFANDDPLTWPIAPLNDRQHIFWKRGCHVLWLYQQITIPETLTGYPLSGLTLRLSLAWWAEDSKIYVNGQFIQAGDLFDYFTRICLTAKAIPEQTFTLAIRLVSPGHDDGALVRSQLIYEIPNDSTLPSPEPGFIADELEVLQQYSQKLAPKHLPHLDKAIQSIDWSALSSPAAPGASPCPTAPPPTGQGFDGELSKTAQDPPRQRPSRHKFHQSLATLRQQLLPLSDWIKHRQLHCLGHAHLDLAWLWPVEDTWHAAERTFESVISLQNDFPELTYTHSSPALFAWLEAHRPDLFKTIQTKVQEGTWSIDAGLWVEPELNIVSGESIARQILYGQRYCQEKFGQISKIAWLPDTFGFCGQLPQLLKLGGIEVFATQKLRWNDTTEFPHELFTWQAPDGSQVLGWTLPPIGTDFDPVAIATYCAQWESKTNIPTALWLPGIGDHGGGPTRDMLEKARRWAKSPFFPTVTFSSATDFLQQLRPQSQLQETPTPLISLSNVIKPSPPIAKGAAPSPFLPLSPESEDQPLPLWTDELYLELHRGCYTTHADQKRFNRRCEDLLYEAELWSSIAQLIAQQPYPQTDLEQAWKKILFNQFHDILPGSSIPQVFEDANRGWTIAQQTVQQILDQALDTIAQTLRGPATTTPSLKAPPHHNGKPLLVFNALNWERTAVISHLIPLQSPEKPLDWSIYDVEGQPIPTQTQSITHAGQTVDEITFLAQDIPPMGYRNYWLCPVRPNDPTAISAPQLLSKTALETQSNYHLENQFLKITVNATTGEIANLVAKQHPQPIFSGPTNQLQAFRDQGQYWDAWNIAPDYADHPLPPAQLSAIDWIETGHLRQQLRTTYHLGQSTLIQDYILDAHSPILKIETAIDWQETQVILKVNFPVNREVNHVIYETPFGTITRPTQPHTEAEKAKWEVPAIRWADLSDDHGGISILTDCKHGFDASPNHLRLTLLKAPLWPDPNADRGWHHFTYAIYPHSDTWQKAHTLRLAHGLNMPMQTRIVSPPTSSPSEIAPDATDESNLAPKTIPNAHSFLTLTPKNLVISAFKPSEIDPHQFILRCYEAYGNESHPHLETTLNLKTSTRIDLLEQDLDTAEETITPHQIVTYRLI